MASYGSTLPLWPELGHIVEPRKPRLAGWWSKAPGWWREEAKRAQRRLTEHQFLARLCKHGEHERNCRGWSHKDWLA